MAQPLAANFTIEPTEKGAMKNQPPVISKVDSVLAGDDSADDGVRVLGLDEYKAAALSLAEAFADDHVAMYFIDTPDREGWTKKQKWDQHLRIMEYVTYAHLLKGLVVSAGPNYDCVALW